MNRRGFLGLLAGAVTAGSLFDPEKLLWTPGKKLISIPKPTPIPASARAIIDVAHRYLGVWPISEAEVALGYARLNAMLDSWSTEPFELVHPGAVTAVTYGLAANLVMYQRRRVACPIPEEAYAGAIIDGKMRAVGAMIRHRRATRA